jgi:subtilase family serine protease
MQGLEWGLSLILALIIVVSNVGVPASAMTSMTPDYLRSAYDVTPLLQSGYTGKGVTVAVVNTGIDSNFSSDVAGFDSLYGLPSTNISEVTPYGTNGTDSELPAGETTADVEIVHAMAPDAAILLVLVGTTSLLNGFSYVIDNRVADIAVLSPSWAYWGQGALQTVEGYNNEYAKSVQENITLIAASNDWGSNNSVPWGTVVGGFWYDYLPDSYLMPQYSPYVTAVGGTNLYLNDQSQYGLETAWNRSGGGPSNLFQQPSWQVGAGVPKNGMRDIPDIAFDSSCDTPVSFYWNGGPGWFCGTSAAAPLFAGIVADIDQAAGRSLGFLNPKLYSIASSDPGAFHDIVSGCSILRNGSNYTTGYCASSGWDFVTGLGSVDASRLARDLVPSIPVPEFPASVVALTVGLGTLLAVAVERRTRPQPTDEVPR